MSTHNDSLATYTVTELTQSVQLYQYSVHLVPPPSTQSASSSFAFSSAHSAPQFYCKAPQIASPRREQNNKKKHLHHQLDTLSIHTLSSSYLPITLSSNYYYYMLLLFTHCPQINFALIVHTPPHTQIASSLLHTINDKDHHHRLATN